MGEIDFNASSVLNPLKNWEDEYVVTRLGDGVDLQSEPVGRIYRFGDEFVKYSAGRWADTVATLLDNQNFPI